MPPRLSPSSGSLLRKTKSPIDIVFCPSCSTWRLAAPNQPQRALTVQPKRNSSRSSPPPKDSPFRTPRRHATSQVPFPTDLSHTTRALPPTPSPPFTTSHLTSRTAINAPIDVPPHLQPLYSALDALKHSAAEYVNISRLTLAMRGLERGGDRVRIGVYSLGDDTTAARRLVRVLLADPLGEEAEWERKLEQMEGLGRGALLVRYGDVEEGVVQEGLVPTLYVPSRVLKRYNVELLVTSLDVGRGVGERDPYEPLLVPTLQIPIARTGRVGYVTYPVHRALVVGQGLEGGINWGKYVDGDVGMDGSSGYRDMVKVSVNIPGLSSEGRSEEESAVAAVDVDLAAHALAKFRESLANSVVYEKGWYGSGMPQLSEWLVEGSKAVPEATIDVEPLKPAITSLVESVIESAALAISRSSKEAETGYKAHLVPETTREPIRLGLQDWSRRAHLELRDQLDIAFASRTWRKLRWWKLFWRVDDVGMIAEEVIERRWLREAERGLVFLAGRAEGAGLTKNAILSSEIDLGDVTLRSLRAKKGWLSWLRWSGPDDASLADIYYGRATPGGSRTRNHEPDEGTLQAFSYDEYTPPYPRQISLARSHLTRSMVPPLQSLAQGTVLETISTVSLTSALAAVYYVGWTGVTLFDAGAVAAAGLGWSAWRMQKVWDMGKEKWEGAMRESGRVLLREVQSQMEEVIEKGGAEEVEKEILAEGEKERNMARAVVEGARSQLKEVLKQ